VGSAVTDAEVVAMSYDGHEPGADRASLFMLLLLLVGLVAAAVMIVAVALGWVMSSFWEVAPFAHVFVVGVMIAVWLLALGVTGLLARAITRRRV
jgi:hypothetical protein